MSYQERVNKVLDSLDLGKPIFNVSIRGKYVELQESDWGTELTDTGLINDLVNRFVRRRFDLSTKSYVMDKEEIVNNIGENVLSNMVNVFMQCSPNLKPRRTKVFRDFCTIVSQNRNNEKFKTSMFDIFEYYHTNIQTDSINHENNDVHRKNIYQLLCLMEKSYGKTTRNK